MITRFSNIIEPMLDAYGYGKFVNHFSFIPMVIVGSIGFIGNAVVGLLSLRLVNKFPLAALYRYLVILSISSSFNCFMFVFSFMPFSIRTFPWLMSHAALVFDIHVYGTLTNTCYFFNTILSIMIQFDRTFVLKGKKPIIPNSRIYLVCLIVLLIVLVMEIPYYLTFQSKSFIVPLYVNNSNGTNESLSFWFLSKTPFSYSKHGRAFHFCNLPRISTIFLFLEGEILIICLGVFRDLILLIVEILMSILVLYHFRVYLNKKVLVTGHDTSNKRNNNSLEEYRETRVSYEHGHARMTKMTICLSILSILEHVMILVNFIIPYTSLFSIKRLFILAAIGFFCNCVKSSLNFVIIFVFNSNYRRELSEWRNN